MSYTTFYHYTSSWGKDAIISSGYIQLSSSNHSHFGPGTYGTGLPPRYGKLNIGINNWTGFHGPRYVSGGKADYAFELKIPSEKVTVANAGSRDILVHHSGQINLKDYDYKVIAVPD